MEGGNAFLHPPTLHPLRQDDDQYPDEKGCISAELCGSDGAGFLQQDEIEVVRVKESVL
jgi:hypothetical protein